MNKFSDYLFKDNTKNWINSLGFVNPTPIQRQVIPLVNKGKDIIGISETGTGKTHAFLIPIMEMIDTDKQCVQAVITAPTRELALQLYTRAQEMMEFDSELKIKLITGGIEKARMSEQLSVQPHVVIGTPGRIKDLFINEQVLRVDTANILVIDEADMTFEFGFLEDVDAIAGKMKKNLQMLSFSATIPHELNQFLKKYMHLPQTIKNEEDHHHNPKIEHILIPCKHETYENKLMELLDMIDPYICLIFANTRVLASKVSEMMRDEGYDIVEIHGDLEPRARKNAMKQILSKDVRFIVATDIAARGIDIDGVSHVISLGFPNELDFYIHRAGRTGRAGKDGICYSLYKKEDETAIKQLQVKGIGFLHKNLKNKIFTDLLKFGSKKPKKDDPMEKEIAKVLTKKKKVVKPGYKVKRKKEIEKIKRRKKREMIQEDIKKQKKEKAKIKQREKNNNE